MVVVAVASRMWFIVFVEGVVFRTYVVVVVVCFSDVEVIIVGVPRLGTYYINFGSGSNITYNKCKPFY